MVSSSNAKRFSRMQSTMDSTSCPSASASRAATYLQFPVAEKYKIICVTSCDRSLFQADKPGSACSFSMSESSRSTSVSVFFIFPPQRPNHFVELYIYNHLAHQIPIYFIIAKSSPEHNSRPDISGRLAPCAVRRQKSLEKKNRLIAWPAILHYNDWKEVVSHGE